MGVARSERFSFNDDFMTKKPRGFAAMSPEKRRAAASKGGESVPAHKRAFSKDRDLAATAGKSRRKTPADEDGFIR